MMTHLVKINFCSKTNYDYNFYQFYLIDNEVELLLLKELNGEIKDFCCEDDCEMNHFEIQFIDALEINDSKTIQFFKVKPLIKLNQLLKMSPKEFLSKKLKKMLSIKKINEQEIVNFFSHKTRNELMNLIKKKKLYEIFDYILILYSITPIIMIFNMLKKKFETFCFNEIIKNEKKHHTLHIIKCIYKRNEIYTTLSFIEKYYDNDIKFLEYCDILNNLDSNEMFTVNQRKERFR